MATASLPMALARVVVVLGLLWIVLRLLPRFVGQRNGGSRSAAKGRGRNKHAERTIEIVDRQTLTRTASVFVLRIGDTMHAIGVTEQHVDRLVEIPATVGGPRLVPDEIDLTDGGSTLATPPAAPRSALGRARALLAEGEPATRSPLDIARQRTALVAAHS